MLKAHIELSFILLNFKRALGSFSPKNSQLKFPWISGPLSYIFRIYWVYIEAYDLYVIYFGLFKTCSLFKLHISIFLALYFCIFDPEYGIFPIYIYLYCCIQKVYIPFLSFWRLALAFPFTLKHYRLTWYSKIWKYDEKNPI